MKYKSLKLKRKNCYIAEKISVQTGGNSYSDSESTTISSIDTDGDGEISAEDFCEYFESKTKYTA